MQNLLSNIKSYLNLAHVFDQKIGAKMHFYSPLPCGSQANVKQFSRNFFMVDGVAHGSATLSHQVQVWSKKHQQNRTFAINCCLTESEKDQDGLFQG